ncbi:MAG TPA: ATP-binding protein, partial [Thermoanaerobaculia bacterium]
MTVAEEPRRAPAGAASWIDENQRHLAAALARVRWFLERRAAGEEDDAAADPPPEPSLPAAGLPALEALCRTFDLSPFERDVLLMAAGPELDAGFAELVCDLHGRGSEAAGRARPTFGMALAALPDAHWSALAPSAPLRFWRFVELAGGSPTRGGLAIDERVLGFLTGLRHLDERLAPLLTAVDDPGPAGLVPSHLRQAERITAAWRQATAEGLPLPAVELTGRDAAAQRGIAARAAAELGLALWRLPLSALPHAAAELDSMVRLWDREAVFSGAALLVDAAALGPTAAGHEGGGDDAARAEALSRLVDAVRGPLLVAAPHRLAPGLRPRFEVEVGPPDGGEQRRVW